MKLRSARADDAKALSQLAIDTFTDAFAADNHPDDLAAFFAAHYTVEKVQQDIADPTLATILAEDDGALAAFLQLRPDAPNAHVTARPCAEIKRLYVERRWHGRGLAQRLMQAACDVATQHNAKTLWLGVWEHNARAIAFYRKMGFAVVGDTRFALGSDLQRDLVMAAPLGALD